MPHRPSIPAALPPPRPRSSPPAAPAAPASPIRAAGGEAAGLARPVRLPARAPLQGAGPPATSSSAICSVQVTSPPPGGAVEALRPQGCALGADAVIVTRSQVLNILDHTLVEGTAIRFKLPRRAAARTGRGTRAVGRLRRPPASPPRRASPHRTVGSLRLRPISPWRRRRRRPLPGRPRGACYLDSPCLARGSSSSTTTPPCSTLLCRLVEAEGWEPVAAARGRQALELIASGPVAAAAVDVLLPDIMGYEVGAALRQQGVPFVFMTGIFKGGRAAEEGQLKHGAAGYFEKPFPGKKLIDALRALVEAAPPAGAAQAKAAAAADADTDDFDVDVAVEDDQPTDALELTGRVVVTEDGRVSAVLRGEAVTAPAGRSPPSPPPPLPAAHRRRDPRRGPGQPRRRRRRRPRAAQGGAARGEPPRAHHRLLAGPADRRAHPAARQGEEDHLLRRRPPLLRHLQPGDRPLRPLPAPHRQDRRRPARGGAGRRREDPAAAPATSWWRCSSSRRPRSSTTWPSR